MTILGVIIVVKTLIAVTIGFVTACTLVYKLLIEKVELA